MTSGLRGSGIFPRSSVLLAILCLLSFSASATPRSRLVDVASRSDP
jgi:hypothetical protein